MQLLVLLGSLRRDSFNRQLAQAVIDDLPENVNAAIFEGLADLPNFDEDLEDRVPAVAQRLRAEIAAADAVLVVTPEYNGNVSGATKNAIDWGSRPREDAALAGKPVAVLAASASPHAGQRARDAAVLSLKVAGAVPLEETFGIPTAHTSFADGRPHESDVAAARQLVGKLLDEARVKVGVV